MQLHPKHLLTSLSCIHTYFLCLMLENNISFGIPSYLRSTHPEHLYKLSFCFKSGEQRCGTRVPGCQYSSHPHRLTSTEEMILCVFTHYVRAQLTILWELCMYCNKSYVCWSYVKKTGKVSWFRFKCVGKPKPIPNCQETMLQAVCHTNKTMERHNDLESPFQVYVTFILSAQKHIWFTEKTRNGSKWVIRTSSKLCRSAVHRNTSFS